MARIIADTTDLFDFQISKEEFVEEFCREDEKKFL
jgi:hypothetical protein